MTTGSGCVGGGLRLSAQYALGFIIGGAMLITVDDARASCGASFCMVNTDWALQAVASRPGWQFDFRYEYIDQDQPMEGSDKVDVAEIPGEHDEIETRNRNYVFGLGYAANETWSASLRLPYVDRSHSHYHNDIGGQELEQWDMTEFGDLQALGRYQLHAEQDKSLIQYGINFGLKLPTGKQNETNADGEEAERTLQPGTGTTDALLGVFYSRMLAGSASSWFVQGLWQTPLDAKDNYRPGQRLTVDAGYRYPVAKNIGLLLQLNALYRDRDSGQQAEPDDSGGRYLFASPGVSLAPARDIRVYGFIQLPVYQNVNGVQLTSDWSAVAGFSKDF